MTTTVGDKRMVQIVTAAKPGLDFSEPGGSELASTTGCSRLSNVTFPHKARPLPPTGLGPF